MEYFVQKNSIVREIWGKSDTVLFIFAGAAAEFALNKAVDWLYFTGRLPTDPLGRLFSTVTYARKIIFAENTTALKTIDSIYQIHKVVENNRGSSIPDWAYRDVLYMLIHYSIASYEVLEKKLSLSEKEEIYDVFYRFGSRMQLKNLAPDYLQWQLQRKDDMQNDLAKSKYTIDLFQQYKKHLGSIRYFILIEGQKLIIPEKIRELLGFRKRSFLSFVLPFYQLSRKVNLDGVIRNIILPKKYKKEIAAIDIKS
jgi:hypothetical protein